MMMMMMMHDCCELIDLDLWWVSVLHAHHYALDPAAT